MTSLHPVSGIAVLNNQFRKATGPYLTDALRID